MTRQPSVDDLYEVAEWLAQINPSSVVAPAAKRVARWLKAQAQERKA